LAPLLVSSGSRRDYKEGSYKIITRTEGRRAKKESAGIVALFPEEVGILSGSAPKLPAGMGNSGSGHLGRSNLTGRLQRRDPEGAKSGS